MKLFLISSSSFYHRIPPIKEYLEAKGFDLVLPNTYETPDLEKDVWEKGFAEHAKFKKELYLLSEEKIKNADAVLCVNFEKHGIPNYIGGATFLELFHAFKYGKKIYLYHDIPEGMLYDEIAGFDPIVIHEDLDLIG